MMTHMITHTHTHTMYACECTYVNIELGREERGLAQICHTVYVYMWYMYTIYTYIICMLHVCTHSHDVRYMLHKYIYM